MSYTVKFIGPRADRDAAALKEIKRYLGAEYFKRVEAVVAQCHAEALPRRELVQQSRTACMFTGISGYHPQRAMMRLFLTKP